MSDKRQFQRVKLDIDGTLSHQTTTIAVVVKDVSLQGLRLSARESLLDQLPFDSHEPYLARFRPNDDSPELTLFIEQLYRHADSRHPDTILGCRLKRGDIESVSALRRIIQLNSSDAELSNKDLDALIEAIYSSASSA
ncbi:PilZ domain-containing protein [Alteromonas halophila]|uniref:PilZ domain-containing protein n=1 Tax=Alteromonas halophila TaxID=516698 RepID=A0A918MZN3_9ALTE|nr:PilZ domain-containing protein [Alteromonas halophila]GGW85915.1 hypothetical protein GCM10007391_19410 [Alteromonas halophila]